LNNPIIENESINFINLYRFGFHIVRKYSKYFFYILLLYTIYYFIKAPSYSSEVSFYTNYNESNTLSSLGVLSSLGGLSQEDGGLGFSVSNYLNSEKLLKQMVEKEYMIDGNKKTLVDYWGNDYNKIFSINPVSFLKKINKHFSLVKDLSVEEKKLLLAKEKLSKRIRYSEDRKSSFHTIAVVVDGDYSLLSRDIVNAIFESIIDYSTEVTSIKAKEKRDFIQGRLLQIKKDLESSEEAMLVFREKNKNRTSPSLILQQDRIQRDIMLYDQLYLSLSDQLELAKIDEKDTTSSIFLLDAAEISSYKDGRGLLENLFFIFIFLFCMLLIFEAYRNKNKLFI